MFLNLYYPPMNYTKSRTLVSSTWLQLFKLMFQFFCFWLEITENKNCPFPEGLQAEARRLGINCKKITMTDSWQIMNGQPYCLLMCGPLRKFTGIPSVISTDIQITPRNPLQDYISVLTPSSNPISRNLDWPPSRFRNWVFNYLSFFCFHRNFCHYMLDF